MLQESHRSDSRAAEADATLDPSPVECNNYFSSANNYVILTIRPPLTVAVSSFGVLP
jgi:hypothetical protein